MILVDTGPLVAALRKSDKHHAWAISQFETRPLPFLTCEAVLTETAYLLQRAGNTPAAIFRLMHEGVISVECLMAEDSVVLEEFIIRYQNVPMDLADACMVRLSELNSSSKILTIDSDFNIYRKNRSNAIEVIMPF